MNTTPDKQHVYEDLRFLQKVKSDLRSTSLVANRKYMFKTYPNCFVGKDFVTWCTRKYKISHEDAVSVGKEMLKRRFFHHVTEDHDFEDRYLFYRLREDEANHRVLNDYESTYTSCRQPLITSGQLLCLLLSVVRFYDGDATQIRSTSEFNEFQMQTTSLYFVDVGEIDEGERLAFWINIFNTLALHSTITSGPPTENPRKQNRFFYYHQYYIGRDAWSLIDIYHGILRGNRSVKNQEPLLSDSDRRILFSCTRLDPRVHFLVNFQAVSCPKITVLTQAGTEASEIDIAVRKYLQSEIRFVPQTSEVSSF